MADEDSAANRLNENFLVFQSNQLITAEYQLTLQEKRFFLVLVSLIKQEDKEFKTYKIDIKDYCKLCDNRVDSQYKHVKEITRNLTTKPIILKGDKSLIQTAFLASAKYIANSGFVEVRFVPELKPYLLQVKKKFTAYMVKHILNLSSVYCINLYETLKANSHKKRLKLSIDDFRKSCRIEKGKYRLYGDLKKSVISKSIQKINECTDIKVSYKELKIGNKTTGLNFTIDEKKKIVQSIRASGHNNPTELLNLLPKEFQNDNGVSKVINNSLKYNSKDYVAENIKYVSNIYLSPEKTIKSYINYLFKSLKENYANYSINSIKKLESFNAKQNEKTLSDERLRNEIKRENQEFVINMKMINKLSEEQLSGFHDFVRDRNPERGDYYIMSDRIRANYIVEYLSIS